MTLTIKTTRMADIQTSEILYFDPEAKDRCYKFCKKRDIDCLPSLTDSDKLYRRDDLTHGFVEESIAHDRIVSASENIFHRSMLDRFRENHLLFVFADNELTGVVHFSDYNRSAVSEYLYGLLSDFEKALRDILVSQKLKNSHMAEYFVERIDSTSGDEKKKYKRKLKAYNDHRGASDNLPHFQTFYLIDLIELLAARNIMQVSDAVNDLRNMIMHAHELVHLENVNADDFIYDFASFETFFNRVMVLQDHYRKAVNKLAFSTVD